jgi:hypothetical protein
VRCLTLCPTRTPPASPYALSQLPPSSAPFRASVQAGPVEQVSHSGSDGVFFSAFVWRPIDRFFYYFVTSTGENSGADIASLILRRFREKQSPNGGPTIARPKPNPQLTRGAHAPLGIYGNSEPAASGQVLSPWQLLHPFTTNRFSRGWSG